MKCHMCQREIKAEEATYSRITEKHYCWPPEWDRCNNIYYRLKAKRDALAQAQESAA